jgi:hypothetical protein
MGLMERPLFQLFVVAVFGLVFAGCGDARHMSKQTSSGSTVVVEHVLTVSRELGPIDEDDFAVLDLGHEATGHELSVIDRLVHHYYAIAVAEDGVAACLMLFSVAAKEVVEKQTEWHVHGRTCAAVMTQIFTRQHRRLVIALGSLKEVRVRVSRPNGKVVLRFKNTVGPSRVLNLRLVRGKWTVQYPLDQLFP